MDCLINGAVIDYPYEKYKAGSLTCISEELVLEGTDWIKGKAETLVEDHLGEHIYDLRIYKKILNRKKPPAQTIKKVIDKFIYFKIKYFIKGKNWKREKKVTDWEVFLTHKTSKIIFF